MLGLSSLCNAIWSISFELYVLCVLDAAEFLLVGRYLPARAGVFVSVTSQSSVETDERIGRESTDGCYRRLILDR